jgi:hypothetical protein
VALHAWDDIYGLALIAAAVWLTLIYFVTARRSRRLSELRPRRFSRGPFLYEKASRPDLKDAGQQLNAVMAAPFEKRRLLNWSEYQAFKIIEADMAAARRGYRVFAQTSLGEVLMSPDEDAFRSINSKRVDILIVISLVGRWRLSNIRVTGITRALRQPGTRSRKKRSARPESATLKSLPLIAPSKSDHACASSFGWQASGTPYLI